MLYKLNYLFFFLINKVGYDKFTFSKKNQVKIFQVKMVAQSHSNQITKEKQNEYYSNIVEYIKHHQDIISYV